MKANPYFVVDTAYFDRTFKEELVASLSKDQPLYEALSGLLVNGDNFHALRLLDEQYRDTVQCVYIDPPYNTDASAILYKNNYKDSSWLSLMADRLALSARWLKSTGVLCCAIDDEEAWHLRCVLQRQFAREIGMACVRSNPAGRKSKGQFSPCHEYAMFFGGTDAVPGWLEKTSRENEQFPEVDEVGRFSWTNLIRTGSGARREDRPKLYFPIYVDSDDGIRVPKMTWMDQEREWRVIDKPKEGEVAVWPRKGNVLRRWHRGGDRIMAEPNEYRVQRMDRKGRQEIRVSFKARMDPRSAPRSLWVDAKYASAIHGAKEMKSLFGRKVFDFPKSRRLVEDCVRAAGGVDPTAVVLDFFAGSGTTGHAVLSLNRADGGCRKYVLVEVGRQFDDVILPRMKRATYSENWKNGRPVDRRGVSQFFQYVRLESYDDALDSIELTAKNHLLRSAEESDFLAEYRLRYALGEESTGSASLAGEEFRDPSRYTLSVVRDGARREAVVDLPATFNFLLGLRVEQQIRVEGVLAILGVNRRARRCLVLWRNVDKVGAVALNRWFDSHRERIAKDVDIIYVNGDHALNNRRWPKDHWEARTIESVFRRLMFDEDSGEGSVP